MKRILYMRTDITYQPLLAGGSVAHTIGVVNELMRAGHQLICCSSVMHDYFRGLRVKQFVPLHIGWFLPLFRWRIGCFISNILFFICIVCRVSSAEVELVYHRYSMLNVVGVLLARWYSVPLLLEFNASESWKDRNWSGRSWGRFSWLINKIEQVNVAYADGIVVVSQVLKDTLIALGVPEQKILVVPNGVDPDVYIPDSRPSNHASDLGTASELCFGFSGTFGPWHGIDTLEHMIVSIVAQYPSVTFILIGDGLLKQQLQDQLHAQGIDESTVRFTGLISPTRARELLRMCDAFILPTCPNDDGSRFFGSPTKLFEYMSYAKPIIASDIEQIGQILSPALLINSFSYHAQVLTNQMAILADPADPDQFVHAAEYLIGMSAAARERMGDNARERVVARYTWRHHVHKIIQFSSALQ